MSETNTAETIADLTRKATPAITLQTKDGREFLILPDPAEHIDVSDPYGLKVAPPRYVSQSVTLQKRDSLVDYVNRYKSVRTVLMANIDRNAILAHINYHAVPTETDGDAIATTNAHLATMTLPYSLEWETWKRIDGNLMPQLDFARFIEENSPDIAAPSGADLLEVVKDLQANRKVNFTQAVRTSSENESFEYTVDNNVARPSGSIELPTQFKLSIPVYFGEPNSELYANLRWKIAPEGGGLALGIKLHRAEAVRQAVFQAIALAIADATKCTLMYGTTG